MQAQLAEAEVEHRRDGLCCKALAMAGGFYDISDAHTLTADMAVVVVDHAKAAISSDVGDRPKSIIGRRTINEIAHRALAFYSFRVDGLVPEAHRLGVGEAIVHR